MTFQQQSTEAKRESFPRTIPFYEDTTPGRQIWGVFFSILLFCTHSALFFPFPPLTRAGEVPLDCAQPWICPEFQQRSRVLLRAEGSIQGM